MIIKKEVREISLADLKVGTKLQRLKQYDIGPENVAKSSEMTPHT